MTLLHFNIKLVNNLLQRLHKLCRLGAVRFKSSKGNIQDFLNGIHEDGKLFHCFIGEYQSSLLHFVRRLLNI